MRKLLILPLLALCAVLPFASSALADDPDPPDLTSPAPVAVNDSAAQNFAALVLRFRGGQLLLNNRRGQAQNIEVICRHPDAVARFLCVAKLDISIRTRSGFDRDRFRHSSVRRDDDIHHGHPHPAPRPDREVQRFSCVAALRVNAERGRPFLQVLARDCVRVANTGQGPGY